MNIFSDAYQKGIKDAIDLTRSGISKKLPIDYILDSIEKRFCREENTVMRSE